MPLSLRQPTVKREVKAIRELVGCACTGTRERWERRRLAGVLGCEGSIHAGETPALPVRSMESTLSRLRMKWDREPRIIVRLPKRLATIPPLPFRRGEGRGEGSLSLCGRSESVVHGKFEAMFSCF